MIGENVTSNASFAAWVGKPHGSNILFDTLWAEGCVFFARTTQPQAIMHLETESNVYGRTVHPLNRELTPGGSSGGESALLDLQRRESQPPAFKPPTWAVIPSLAALAP
ncbi:hypothetical protein LB505_010045 [Fusarium chuoi]|nr:hypothetical protein LB505_010045 [Fusarium chuoi]